MKTHLDLIQDEVQIKKISDVIAESDVFCFDTEFIRESTFYPVVEILQVATREEAWLIDVRAFLKEGREKAVQKLKPLLDLFKSEKHLKIVHAAHGDQECLLSAFGVLASPLVDTAVIASVCGYGENAGLATLLKNILGVQIDKGHARTNWTERPLPEPLKKYAIADVTHLVELGEKLLAEAEKLNRKDWAFKLCLPFTDPKLYEIDPEEHGFRLLKGNRADDQAYGVLVELIKWREKRVRQLNIPRRWVAEDSILVSLSQVRPKDLKHLQSFRGLSKGELKDGGKEIFEAIERGLSQYEPKKVRSMRSEIPSVDEEQIVGLLKVLAGAIAEEKRISLKFLISNQNWIRLIRTEPNHQQWVKDGILTEEGGKILGEELESFLKGGKALAVENGRLKVVTVS